MTTALLAAELRAGRASAINRVRSALQQGGSIAKAAKVLELNPLTLRNWATRSDQNSIKAVADLVDELDMRKPGRRPKSLK